MNAGKFTKVMMRLGVVLGLLLAVMPAFAKTLGGHTPQSSLIVTEFDTTLEPGVNDFNLGPSTLDRGYVVEITPLDLIVSGVESYTVRPEFDGTQWNDVLRIMVPVDWPALDVNIRVYDVSYWKETLELTTSLEPGVWHGFGLGRSSLDCAYVAEINPLQPSITGAHLEGIVVQPEYDGSEWFDVLRIMIPLDNPQLDVHVRIYLNCAGPVDAKFSVTLEPGEWQGYILGPASLKHGHVIELSPLHASVDGAHIMRYTVQPEFDGVQWNDVLHLQIPPLDPALDVQVRVWVLPGESLFLPIVLNNR